MPTSAISRRPEPASSKRAAGFTLLEILVVIVVAALVLGASSLQVVRMYESYERNTQRDDILLQISRLGVRAVQEGEPLVLEGRQTRTSELLDIPEGWNVELPQPVEFTYRGLCTGGRVALRNKGSVYEYVLSPPLCEAVPLDAAEKADELYQEEDISS